MGNNKQYKADYKVKTSTGHCPLGFKQTSGNTNTLASRGAKLIILPEPTSGKWKGWNHAVNTVIRLKLELAMTALEEMYKEINKR